MYIIFLIQFGFVLYINSQSLSNPRLVSPLLTRYAYYRECLLMNIMNPWNEFVISFYSGIVIDFISIMGLHFWWSVLTATALWEQWSRRRMSRVWMSSCIPHDTGVWICLFMALMFTSSDIPATSWLPRVQWSYRDQCLVLPRGRCCIYPLGFQWSYWNRFRDKYLFPLH